MGVFDSVQEETSESETNEDEEDKAKEKRKQQHAMFMRRASVNVYHGQGMEIADWDAAEEEEVRRETLDKYNHDGDPHTTTFFRSEDIGQKQRSASFNESMSLGREVNFPEAGVIQRSLSEDELSSMLTVIRGKCT